MNEKARILVVDDDSHMLQGLSRILKSAGYETIEAATGTDALRLTSEQKPDLVLLDVILPDINGIEVCNRIKSDKTLADCYVVLLSSFRTSSDDQAVGLETGADGYIARPVSNRELVARVEALLRLKRAEEQLRESEERYRTVADFTYDWEYWVDSEGNFLYVSPSCVRITGYSAQEFLDDPRLLDRIVHPDDLDKAMNHFHVARKVDHETSYSLDFRVIHRDGHTLWVNHACQPVFGKEGQPLGRRACNRDITERKKAEESAKETSAFLSSLLNAIPVPIFYKDTDGRYTGFNKLYEEFLGKTHQELLGKSVFDIAPRDLAETYHAKDLELFHNPGIQVYDSKVKDARGAVHDVVFYKSTFADPQGHVRGLIGALLDRLTHRVHILEANGESYRLRHAKKRASRTPNHIQPQT